MENLDKIAQTENTLKEFKSVICELLFYIRNGLDMGGDVKERAALMMYISRRCIEAGSQIEELRQNLLKNME